MYEEDFRTNRNNQHDWFCLWADWKLSGKKESIIDRLYNSGPL